MKVLVTGGGGYLGSVLLPRLLMRGHQVRVLDVGYFGLGHLQALRPNLELVREDVRRVGSDAAFLDDLLNGIDCIIHLAAISNDPSAELHPDLTDEVNFRATEALAERAKAKGVKLVFSSSCSVYGAGEGESDENGALNPLTVYAVSKVNAEAVLESLADDAWRPVILRNGTLFGYSPRMRFDLVVNIFSLYSTLYNEITVFGDGLQWRPYLHVKDCARAFVFLAEQPNLPHLCYNVAHESLRVVDLGEIFQRINPRVGVKHLSLENEDKRDYRVTTQRIHEAGFEGRIGVELGAEEMVEAILSGLIPDPESIYYRNAKWLKELTQLGDGSHRDIVNMIETMAQVRVPSPR